MRRAALAVLLLLVFAAATAFFWARMQFNAPGPAARSGHETVVLIPAGESVSQIAQTLQAAGVISSAAVFEAETRLNGQAKRLKAGEYAIPSGASMARIAAILIEGKSIEHKLTVPEGFTSDMAYHAILDDPVLVGTLPWAPKEGSLLPDTYLFIRGTTRKELVARMQIAQQKLLNRLWPQRAAGLPIQTREQAVILASIVEKETALPVERRHIAAVFENRLRRGMKLQSDPTIIYGISKGYPLGHPIRQSELTGATPYNTYVIGGLPPTPICNPGRDSIKAVLNPMVSDDLYFVADGSGGHVFSAAIAEHEKNVAHWRQFEKAHGH